jgi:hypothetical protein
VRSQGLDTADDAEPEQVLLETQIIATSEETAGWLVDAVDTDGGEVVMELIAEDSRVRILTCPSIVSQEGQEASLFVGNAHRVLTPPETASDEVRPVEIEFVGGEQGVVETRAVERGVRLKLLSGPAVEGTRTVRVSFERFFEGILEHRLDRDVQLRDGRTILLRIGHAVE